MDTQRREGATPTSKTKYERQIETKPNKLNSQNKTEFQARPTTTGLDAKADMGSECNWKNCHAICHLPTIFGRERRPYRCHCDPTPRDNRKQGKWTTEKGKQGHENETKQTTKLMGNARSGDAAREEQDVARKKSRRRRGSECRLFRTPSTAAVVVSLSCPPGGDATDKTKTKIKNKNRRYRQYFVSDSPPTKTNKTYFTRIKKRKKTKTNTQQNHIRNSSRSLQHE